MGRAAAIATITRLQETDGVAQIGRGGTLRRQGRDAQAQAHGVAITQSGPVQGPALRFGGDDMTTMQIPRAMMFAGEAAKRGVYMHPTHHWFLSTAHSDEDIERSLAATDVAFARVKESFGDG